ncbi:Putative zinc-finger [Lentzea fradiae]|uniref:Putative zinc-finger n=1 Tax=Lentzea fradiae TaxID=200378 RepID=A0A1G7TJT9_9PSEU|nr:zf-HC2 domain-containing protein [Lentzea fradiae]SDG35603.1 Putative zinc-finger [Lentzea fradiae]
MSCPHTVEVGAYLFGSLDLAERAVFERHLGDCAGCQAELLRLAPLPGLLGRLTLDDVENLDDLPAVPPKPRRRGRVALVAAAVLVVGAVVGGVLFLQPPPGPTWAARDPGTGVGGEVSLVSRSWGTEMWFELGDVTPGARCKVVVFDRRGQRETGGWWGTPHGSGERVPGATSFRVDEIDRLEVSDETGLLVTLRP